MGALIINSFLEHNLFITALPNAGNEGVGGGGGGGRGGGLS